MQCQSAVADRKRPSPLEHVLSLSRQMQNTRVLKGAGGCLFFAVPQLTRRGCRGHAGSTMANRHTAPNNAMAFYVRTYVPNGGETQPGLPGEAG